MALIAYLHVNKNPVGWVAATREASKVNSVPRDHEVFRYRVEAEVSGEAVTSYVMHRYGDGAVALMAKAMEEVQRVSCTKGRRCDWYGEFVSQKGNVYQAQCSAEPGHRGDHRWAGMRVSRAPEGG